MTDTLSLRMSAYTVTFAGLHVVIQYDTTEVRDFLAVLFHDVQGVADSGYEKIILITREKAGRQYILSMDDTVLVTGELGAHFAAVLFDAVFFNLLDTNNQGISFHAAAVAYRGKVILLPGESGAGKSTLTACLLAHDFSYLTDELFFIPANDPGSTLSFTRPVCIKSGAVPVVKSFIGEHSPSEMLEDDYGLIVPHRILNQDFSEQRSMPSLLLFPRYQKDALFAMEEISAARACSSLMACNVNGRNFSDHGFQQIVRLARSTPACRVTYGSCAEFPGALAGYFSKWIETA